MQETEEFQPNMVIETKETISYLGYPVYPKSIRVKENIQIYTQNISSYYYTNRKHIQTSSLRGKVSFAINWLI